MIRLGILGDIGSGKSYVAKKFGYPVFNADQEVARIYRKNLKCFKKLKKTLPNYITSFPIKKNQISRSIIDNKKNLKKIIKIIHPEVRSSMNLFLKKNKNKKFIDLDIHLLLESKINKKNDILIFIQANKKEIFKRLKKRKNFSKKIYKKLKKIQLPLEVKKRKAKFILRNNFTSKSVKEDIIKIKNKIQND